MVPADPLDLTGRVAWVTGAARGIGLACVELLQAHGATVVAIDLQQASKGRAWALDVADSRAVNEAAGCLASEGLAPDVLVNNAGVTRDAVLWKLSDEDWATVMRVNLDGAFHLTRACTPLMRPKGGSIINVSSINGQRGKFGQSNYCASKAALIGFTKAAARELGRFGIRVNAVAPGMVETAMTEGVPQEARQRALDETLLGRLAQPADIANAVLFLCSGLAGHVTGQVLRVDGGQYL